ncbi:MAG: PilZ domain-containing protein [Proteobacteria bacterium]|nr:PilZ domain-containing protein [Pseudomonadota bacterium]MBU1584872.1 PilZ domain-containing protein [Pseudomonadota bacterium]MBU2628754.1 PilZ domain-containing protein [Pseudomonadota bacterium]
MKKRSCERFSIPGTTLFYKNKPRFFGKSRYSNDYFPVINMSRGGASFLCDQRLKAGTLLIVKVNIPGVEKEPEIIADVKWISKNPEQSYKYQTGIAFISYGDGKNENSREILSLLETLEEKSNTV